MDTPFRRVCRLYCLTVFAPLLTPFWMNEKLGLLGFRPKWNAMPLRRFTVLEITQQTLVLSYLHHKYIYIGFV